MQADNWIALAIGCITAIGGFSGLGLLLRHLHKDTKEYLELKIQANADLTKSELKRLEDTIDARLETIDIKFNHLDKRLASIEEKLSQLTHHLIEIHSSHTTHLDMHSRRIG